MRVVGSSLGAHWEHHSENGTIMKISYVHGRQDRTFVSNNK